MFVESDALEMVENVVGYRGILQVVKYIKD